MNGGTRFEQVAAVLWNGSVPSKHGHPKFSPRPPLGLKSISSVVPLPASPM